MSIRNMQDISLGKQEDVVLHCKDEVFPILKTRSKKKFLGVRRTKRLPEMSGFAALQY